MTKWSGARFEEAVGMTYPQGYRRWDIYSMAGLLDSFRR